MSSDNNGGFVPQMVTSDEVPFYVVRLHFSKTGRAKFISHLDLNRTMTRAMRRTALPIWYTEGYNKHPYVTFTAPLSLGFEGLRECMDIRLIAECPMAQVVAQMNAVLPEGLTVSDAAAAVKKPGALFAADYRVTFDCPGDMLTAFLNQETILAEKFSKKKEKKTVDLKPVLADVRPVAEGNTVVLTLTLPCNSTDTVNPSLIGQALNTFAGREIPCHVLRLRLLTDDGAEFI